MDPLSERARSHPVFLDFLDQDHDRAFALYYEYCWRLLTRYSRYAFARVPPDHWEDIISETILHIWKHEQKILRKYADRGRSFEAWLLTAARREAWHYMQDLAGWNDVSFGDDLMNTANHPDLDDQKDLLGNLDLVMQYTNRLGPRCRYLLIASGLGWASRELGHLLGYPAAARKRAANQLSACRRELKSMLAADGVDWRSMLGSRETPRRPKAFLPRTGYPQWRTEGGDQASSYQEPSDG